MRRKQLTRREALMIGASAALGVGAGAGSGAQVQAVPPSSTRGASSMIRSSMATRTIPKSGEEIPRVGLGTWQTFDVGSAQSERANVRAVIQRFVAAGGRVIDSSPMYGRAEAVTGEELVALGKRDQAFLATKVWTTGKQAGMRQMAESMHHMRADRIDLMQVHNLVDWTTHLPVLREWKQAGKVRYIGVTHYAHSAFGDLERLMRDEKLDFVQLPYSLADREAEKRLLPAAADTGTAVLVMRPFQEGELFRLVRGKPLPAWAAEFQCASWAQFFLKFILGHPAVTCPIPATSNPKHVSDNVQAGFGSLPDQAMRKKMVETIAAPTRE